MKNKYKIGDKVKFINCDDRTIPNYHYGDNSNIPDEYIKHGSIVFKINEGEIIHIYDKYYIVRYIDAYNKQVQLGFKEENIELLNNNIKNSNIKNIEDYKRKEVYIKVNTKEEAKKLIPLLNSIYNDWRIGYFQKLPRYVNMFEDSIDNTNNNSTYEVIEASEFFEEVKEVSLVGRYIKALVNNPNDARVIKDKYYIIENENYIHITVNSGFVIDKQYQNKYYELMPIGFNIPDEQEVTSKFEVGKYVDKPIKKSECMYLNDSCIGKLVSFKRGEKIYSEVLVTKEKENIYLLNNCYSNNNSHDDKSKYLYSLLYFNWGEVNSECIEVKLLDNIPIKQEVIMEINEFKKGDYILVISGRGDSTSVKNDFIYKQKNNSKNLITEKSSTGYIYNATDVLFDNTKDKWRYATNEEIAEYDRIGKPYDVTTLIKKSNIPEYVECIKSYFYEIEYIKGNIYQIVNNYIGHERGTGIVSINGEQRFIPSTKEAYDKQQALLNGGIFAVEYEGEVEYIPQVGDWVTIKDSSKLRDGCKGCPNGTFIVVEDKKYDNIQGLLPSDEKTFVVKINDSKYWRISMIVVPSIDLSNTKIWIGDNPELSKLVQEKAFELEYNWAFNDRKIKNMDGDSLYFLSNKRINYGNSGKDYFNKEKYKEIYPSDLDIRITKVNILGIEREAFYKELPNNNNNQINKLQRVKPKLIEIKKLN